MFNYINIDFIFKYLQYLIYCKKKINKKILHFTFYVFGSFEKIFNFIIKYLNL